MSNSSAQVTPQDVLRLSRCVISLLSTTHQTLFITKYKQFFRQFFNSKSTTAESLSVTFLELLDLCLGTDCSSVEYESAHYNICQILLILLDYLSAAKVLLDDARIESLWKYLSSFLQTGKNLEAKLNAILCAETLLHLQPTRTPDSLRPILQNLATYTCHNPSLIGKNTKSIPHLYQIGCCASWILDELLVESTQPKIPPNPIKLSPDAYSARNDSRLLLPTVIALSSVSTSPHLYYEVTLLTDGAMRIGFTTREHDFSTATQGLGADRYSIGVDGFAKWIHHAGEKIPLERVRNWVVGDVIGCLVDGEKAEFRFFLNGEPIHFWLKLFKQWHFSSSECYLPAATLSRHQHVYFNFGQHNFRIIPKNLTPNLLKTSDFRLIAPTLAGRESFWFPQLSTAEYFHDSIQSQFYECILEFERTGEMTFSELLANHSNDDHAFPRLLQAIIKMFGVQEVVQPVDVLLQQLMLSLEYFESLPSIGKCTQILASFIRFIEKLMQHDEETIRRRNCCLAILLAHKYYLRLKGASIFEQNAILSEFIEKTVAESTDQLSLLYAILCLDWGFDSLSAKSFLTKRLVYLSDDGSNLDAEDVDDDPLSYQITFCSTWLLQCSATILRGSTWALDPQSCLGQIKLSPSLLSVRNDSLSEYLHVNSATRITTGTYLYEVALLTSGSLQIGWQLSDAFSITFDGFKQTVQIEMEKKREVLNEKKANSVPKWKAGDIVGCLVDLKQSKFKFYLNGTKVKYKKGRLKTRLAVLCEKNCENVAFCASIDIGMFQHCYFNFGQMPFRFAPEHKKYSTFYGEGNKD